MRYLFILILASIASGFIPIIRTPVLSQRGLSLQALPACFAEDALAGGVSQSAVDAAVFAASSIRQGAPIATPFLDPADVGILLSLFNKYVYEALSSKHDFLDILSLTLTYVD